MSFFWPVFSRIRNEYVDLRSKSPYSVRIWKNTTKENFVCGRFSNNENNGYKHLKGIENTRYTENDRYEIGKYASENNNLKASDCFKQNFPNLKENTVST